MSPRRAAPQKHSSGLPAWVVPAAIIVLAAAGVVALFMIQSTPSGGGPTSSSGLSGPGRTIGNTASKVALVEYADYQCPICRQFGITVARQIEEAYVKTNKISFTYKYFPVVDGGTTGESHWAAEAAECANQQGKFWEYHDKLLSVWVGERVGTYTKANLKQYAASVGLDTATFNPCLDNDQTASIVQTDANSAENLRLPGTPSFLINGQVFDAQSLDYSTFSRAFDSLLK